MWKNPSKCARPAPDGFDRIRYRVASLEGGSNNLKYKLNLCLVVAVVFILAAGYANAQTLFLIDVQMIEAAEKGDTEKVHALLAQGADVNAKDRRGDTALMGAAYPGHTDTVHALLAKGADVNAKGQNGMTALMGAAIKGNTDTVQALLAHGADVNAKAKGMTALMWAKHKGHKEIVRILKEAGAKE